MEEVNAFLIKKVLFALGELIPWMRYALKTGDFSLIDGYIETSVQQMMFNNGKGRLEVSKKTNVFFSKL